MTRLEQLEARLFNIEKAFDTVMFKLLTEFSPEVGEVIGQEMIAYLSENRVDELQHFTTQDYKRIEEVSE